MCIHICMYVGTYAYVYQNINIHVWPLLAQNLEVSRESSQLALQIPDPKHPKHWRNTAMVHFRGLRWEFPKIRGTLSWGPYNMDPIS